MISLAILLFPMELLTYLSVDHSFSTASIIDMDIPMELIKIENLKPDDLNKQSDAKSEVFNSPIISTRDEMSDNLIINEKIINDTLSESKLDLAKNDLTDSISARKIEEELKDSMPLALLDEVPSYPGGGEALMKYLTSSIKYPARAKEAGIVGVVSVSFLIEKDGSVSKAKVTTGIGGGCNEEALRVVALMPKWKPGKQKGKTIRTHIQIPIVFYLRPG